MRKINNIIIIMSFLLSFIGGNIWLILGMVILLLFSFFIRKYNKNLEFVYLLFIVISYLFGYIFDFYNKVYFFDAIAHSLFGFVSSVFSLPLLKKFKIFDCSNMFFNSLFIIIFTLAMASVWEMIEFVIDKIFLSNMQRSLNNTMKDIISALLFSFVYCLFYLDNKKLIEKLFIVRN